MTRSRTAILTLFAGLLAAGFVIAAADAPASDEGFVPLFNGKDTTGWVYGTKGGKTAKSGDGYEVKDGVLYCTKEDGGNLFTEKDYADFVLRFDFKLEPNANNGLGIRAPLEGDIAYSGMELQILDDSGSQYDGKLQPFQYHGSIYGCVAAKRGSLKPVGEWNTQEVVARGRHVKVTLNGTVIVDADLDRDVTDPAVRAKHPGLDRKTGRIGLLGHGTRVEFRNIRVKELN